jgi:signal transduction histidine kinase
MIDQLAPLSVLLDNLFRSATTSFTENVQLKERELVNVYDIVQQNIGFLLYAAKRKKIQIANQVGKSARIWASADQIDVVFRNVIANAVKFTPVGGVILISAVVKKGNIEFVIADTGIGMSAEQLQNLFSANKKISVGTDNERGTGLGLLITKEYVLENGGEIVVTSELNKGTTFRIIFPCPGRN